MKNPIRIDNSRFMELVDEIATEMMEMKFGSDAWTSKISNPMVVVLTDEAQDYYNDKYDEIENRFNKYRIYSDYTDGADSSTT